MNTIVILLLCAGTSAALVFILGLCLAASRPRPRNRRTHRLGRFLSVSHPEWF